MKSISKLRLKDSQTDKIVSESVDAINFLLQNTIKKNSIITITLQIGDNFIYHNQSFIPVGYVIIDKNANANIYRPGNIDSDIIVLNSDAVVTVKILFI